MYAFCFSDVYKMNYSDTSVLLSALNTGNILAFEYVYKTYYKGLVNYASRILGDSEASKDAVQQAFYRMWENRAVLTLALSPRAYLYRSVYNNCLNSIGLKRRFRSMRRSS